MYLFTEKKKNGVDVGELLGIAAVGVIASNDRDAFLALDAEIVVYLARDVGDFAADKDIIDILEAGKNIVTALPYHYPKVRGVEVAERLEAACQIGNATLFASGGFPGFIVEHLAMTLTVAVSNIKHIRVMETFEASGIGSAEMVTTLTGGCELDGESKSTPAYIMSKNYYPPVIQLIADQMGVELDVIEGICKSVPADKEIQVGELTIKEGKVTTVSYEWTGFVNGKPFITLNPQWYMTDEYRPPEATSDECWIVTIEGTPSVQCKLDSQASFENDFRVHDDDPTFGGLLLNRYSDDTGNSFCYRCAGRD